MRAGTQWLEDILAAIHRIQRYSSLGREVFEQDELIQVWINFHLILIGEAARSYSQSELDNGLLDIPWQDIVGMRNFLVHEYFNANMDIIWDTVEQDLPRLEVQIRGLLGLAEEPLP